MDFISLEDYEYEYNFFLAEQELFESLVNLQQTEILNESINYIYLQEGLKDTIMNYLSKVVSSVQNAWRKLLKNIQDGPGTMFLNKYKNEFENPIDLKLSIKNFPVYQENVFNTEDSRYNIQTLDYEKMKDYLTTDKDFIKKFYPVFDDPKLNIKQKFLELAIFKKEDQRITDAEFIKSIYVWSSETYKEICNNLNKELDNLNQSNENINRLISQITPAETQQTINTAVQQAQPQQQTTTTIQHSSAMIYLEADTKPAIPAPGQNQKDNKSDNMTIESPEKSNNNKEDAEKQKNLVKQVQVYMRVSCDILSGRMAIFTSRRNTYIKILKAYINNLPKNKNANNNQKQQETQTNNGVPQIQK